MAGGSDSCADDGQAPVNEAAESVYAGLDLGTSGCNGVLVTAAGRVIARAAARYPTHRPEPGAAEQQPGDWLNAFTSVTLGIAQAVAVERWQAVGLSAMLPTLVLTDGVGAAATPGGIDAPSSRRHLEPLGPAITWEDGRAEAEGSAFREGFGGDALYRRTGQWVDGRYLLPMALRLGAGESRHCLAVLEAAAGRGEILMAGGGALAPSLAADLADATGRAVHPPDPSLTDSSAIGAAIVAAAGADGQLVAVHHEEERPGWVPTAAAPPGGSGRRSGMSPRSRARSLADDAVEGGQALDDAEDGEREPGDHDQRDRDAPVPDAEGRADEDDDHDPGVVLGLRRLDGHGDSWHVLPCDERSSPVRAQAPASAGLAAPLIRVVGTCRTTRMKRVFARSRGRGSVTTCN
jgi:hypothetical protein